MEIGWPLVFFSLLAGCGGCAFAYAGLSECTGTAKAARVPAAIVSLVLVIVGGCCSVAHLASPQNVMAAVWNLGSFSGISVELMLIGIVAILLIAYLVASKRNASAQALKVLGVVGGIFGLLLAFFTGHGYVIEAQAAWNTEALPAAYLGTALALGAFIYALVAARTDVAEDDMAKIATPVGVGALLGALSIVCYVVAVGFGTAATQPVVLWGGLVLCGVVVTAVCGVLYMTHKTFGNPLVVPVVGLVGAFVGALALRSFMWLLGSGFLNLFAIATGPRGVFLS